MPVTMVVKRERSPKRRSSAVRSVRGRPICRMASATASPEPMT
jgi:hypothetical protein